MLEDLSVKALKYTKYGQYDFSEMIRELFK